MSRRGYRLGVALVALALAVTDRALSLRPGVTERNVRRIRAEMTPAQVEAIAGGEGWQGDAPHRLKDSFLCTRDDNGVARWYYHGIGAAG
jgi:hypothetical protein